MPTRSYPTSGTRKVGWFKRSWRHLIECVPLATRERLGHRIADHRIGEDPVDDQLLIGDP